MSFPNGLAASPDPSNDVQVDHTDQRAAHDRLLHEAHDQVEQFNEARHHTDTEDESHHIPGSFDFSNRNLESLPADLANIISPHAERLGLRRNRLTGLSALGPRFPEFKKLRYLVLSDNLLQEFPHHVSSFW